MALKHGNAHRLAVGAQQREKNPGSADSLCLFARIAQISSETPPERPGSQNNFTSPRRVTVVLPRITLLELIQRVFRISRDRAVLFFEYLQALRRDPLAAEDR